MLMSNGIVSFFFFQMWSHCNGGPIFELQFQVINLREARNVTSFEHVVITIRKLVKTLTVPFNS